MTAQSCAKPALYNLALLVYGCFYEQTTQTYMHQTDPHSGRRKYVGRIEYLYLSELS